MKRIYHKLRIPFMLLGLLFLMGSCNYYESWKLRRAIKHEYGRVLDFSWPGFQVLQDTVLSDFEIKKPITVVSHIYKELCPECFANYLKVAEKFVNQFHTDSVQYVCISYPRPVRELQCALSLAKIDSTKVMIVYDSNNRYLSANSITKLGSGYNAFLIDEDHKVVLLGDPIRTESMLALCTKTIRSMLNSK